MKNLYVITAVIFACCFCSCKKEDAPDKEIEIPTVNVKVAIDYVGSGGYYDDDIESVPSGLIVGTTNGPFKVPLTKTYTIRYKANNSFKELTYQTNFGGGILSTINTYVIHCYVNGNTEHIEVKPE